MATPENKSRAAGKPKRGGFQPGVSGNPGGRPKTNPEVKAALKAACPRAVARLVELLESDDERVALRAAEVIIERVEGKVPQALEHSGEGGAPIRFVLDLGEAA